MRPLSEPITHLRHVLLDGDISILVLLGGLGLILWAGFGTYAFASDLSAYANMFPFGNGAFWVANYVGCGVAMWLLVAYRFPPLASLLVGSWVTVIWSWSAFARMVQVATFQTGNATSVIYVLVGMLIIHRSAKR